MEGPGVSLEQRTVRGFLYSSPIRNQVITLLFIKHTVNRSAVLNSCGWWHVY